MTHATGLAAVAEELVEQPRVVVQVGVWVPAGQAGQQDSVVSGQFGLVPAEIE